LIGNGKGNFVEKPLWGAQKSDVINGLMRRETIINKRICNIKKNQSMMVERKSGQRFFPYSTVTKSFFLFLFIFLITLCSFSQPQPGDVFTEYFCEGMRVGGNEDYGGHDIRIKARFQLAGAKKAEIMIENLQCHTGTRGLAVSVNGNEWLSVPPPHTIPQPRHQYQYFSNITIPLPLAHLHKGTGNKFKLKVDETEGWWPQNLVMGINFRVYYEPDSIIHGTGRIIAPVPGEKIGTNTKVKISAHVTHPEYAIKKVDVFAHCYDIDYNGDGIYSEWKMKKHKKSYIFSVGSATQEPWEVNWDTKWLPDQKAPMKLMAWITIKGWVEGVNKAYYMTEAVEGLELERKKYSVELCEPFDIPKHWVTRKGAAAENITIHGDIAKAQAAQLVWSSWSPCYSPGVFVNEKQVWEPGAKEDDPCYEYKLHRVLLSDVSILRNGLNIIGTGHPKKHGTHGMEVNWPGIQLLVRYGK